MLLPSPLSAANAIATCASSPTMVVLTVWPSGNGQVAQIQSWLHDSGAQILHCSTVPLRTSIAELLCVMALYDGEDWLETNHWYMEQPLPGGRPDGPFAGAKWKRELCFKGSNREPIAIVADVSQASTSLWSEKYTIRAALARASGNPGNSCIHLTDEQDSGVLAAYRSGGARRLACSCDDSYAYACARALLHPASIAWLNSGAGGLALSELGSPTFRAAWTRYTDWLHSPRPSSDDAFPEAPSFASDANAT